MNTSVRTLSSLRRQRGAALVIGLVLLMILTLLALTGMNTASTELVMAGNEQYRRNASLAATAGIEEAISNIATLPTAPGSEAVVEPTVVEGTESDTYETVSRYVGIETGLPQSSVDKFVGVHYVIESTGASARNARDTQVQGVFVISGSGGGNGSFGSIN